MRCVNFWKMTVPFALTLAIGILAGTLIPQLFGKGRETPKPAVETVVTKQGMGCSTHSSRTDFRTSQSKNPAVDAAATKPLKIISKPRAFYTDLARRNQTEGKVVLKITFLAGGEIGAIYPVKNLPDGLTEMAIGAARGIRFEPAIENGRAVSVTKTVEYNFTIY